MELHLEKNSHLLRFAKSFIQVAEIKSSEAPTKSLISHVVSYTAMAFGFGLGAGIPLLTCGIPSHLGGKFLGDAARTGVNYLQDKRQANLNKDVQIRIKQAILKGHGSNHEDNFKNLSRFFLTKAATDIFLRFYSTIIKWCLLNDPDFALIEEIGEYAGTRFYGKLQTADNITDVVRAFVGAPKTKSKRLITFAERPLNSITLENNKFKKIFRTPIPALQTETGLHIIRCSKIDTSTTKVQSIRPPFEFEQTEIEKLLNGDNPHKNTISVELDSFQNADASSFKWEDCTAIAVKVFEVLQTDPDLNSNNHLYEKVTQFIQTSSQDLYQLLNTILKTLQDLQIPPMASPHQPGIVTTMHHHIDEPSHHFTGRIELLSRIHNRLTECYVEEHHKNRIVLLCGLGGMGKSELARKYVETYMKNDIIQNVAWIDAETQTSLKKSFTYLAKSLGITVATESENIKEIVRNVYQHFAKHVRTGLFIFDNSQLLNHSEFELSNYLPTMQHLECRPLILVTSRNREWDIPKKNIILIEELSLRESVELLKRKFQLSTISSQNEKDYEFEIEELAKLFQGYPLGLALATSNIVKSDWTELKDEIKAYRELISKSHGSKLKDGQTAKGTKYELVMENVWEVTLAKIEEFEENGRNALEILNIMSYLPTDQITVEKVLDILNTLQATDIEITNKDFSVLEKYSVVTIYHEKYWKGGDGELIRRRIRIHRLVQRYARERLQRIETDAYLLGVCNYFVTREDRDRDTLVSLHHNLKDMNWPQNSVCFSIIFCYFMLPITDDCNLSFDNGKGIEWANLVDDVEDYFKSCRDFLENSHRPRGTPIQVLKILHRCVGIRLNKNLHEMERFFKLCIYMAHKRLPGKVDALKSTKKFEKCLLSYVKPSIRHTICTECDTNNIIGVKFVERYCYEACLKIFGAADFLGKKLRAKVGTDILSVVNTMSWESNQPERIDHVFSLLWNFCIHSENTDSLQFVEAVFKIHFKVYPKLLKESCRQESHQLLKKYWKDGGPLRFDVFRNLHKRNWGQEQASEMVRKFFKRCGGHKIIADYLLAVSRRKNDETVQQIIKSIDPTQAELSSSSVKAKVKTSSHQTAKSEVYDFELIDQQSLHLLEKLNGSVATVYRGEWRKQNGSSEKVVVKILHNNFKDGAWQLFDALEVVNIQLTLRHPNTVQILGISFSLDQDLWIVNKFVEGKTLFQLLSPYNGLDNVFSFEQKIKVCLDMCNIIAHIHQKGYVHRQVKPVDMMVNESGRLIMMDFVCTQFVGKSESMNRSSSCPTPVVGTPSYMAPENFRPLLLHGESCSQKPTCSGDIWSLGVTFYEVFTRLRLIIPLKHKMLDNDTVVKERIIDLPECLRTVVSKCLDFDPMKRPSAQELCDFFYELSTKFN